MIVDALGGLRDRAALQSAAARAGAPLVSAGISGLTGWMAVVLPGEEGPAAYLGAGDEGGGGVEEKEGNLAPSPPPCKPRKSLSCSPENRTKKDCFSSTLRKTCLLR